MTPRQEHGADSPDADQLLYIARELEDAAARVALSGFLGARPSERDATWTVVSPRGRVILRNGRIQIEPGSGGRGEECDPPAPSQTARLSKPVLNSDVDLMRARLRTAGEIATLLGIPEKSVLHYARDRRLPSVRIGKHVRFVLADVEATIAASRTASC